MELSTPKGTRDFPPEEGLIRQKILKILRESFEQFGFNPLETPSLEGLDILSSKYAGGAEILKEVFKVTDQGGRELGLRYDLTVPFSRFIGMNPNLRMPFKRYQLDKVWRDGPIGLGRYREFLQCDVDVVGCADMVADSEIIAIIDMVFKKFNLASEVKVSNRKFLNGLLDYAEITKDKESVILTIDKLSKVGEDGVKAELNEKGFSNFTVDKLLDVLDVEGENSEILKKFKDIVVSDEGKEGLDELESLFSYLNSLGIKNVKFEPSLARGLVFYTGTVFETFLKDSPIKSAVASGGRFDNIIGNFLDSDKKYPAVGVSFGLDRIYDALKDVPEFFTKKTVVDFYVIPIKDTLLDSMKVAQKLRASGLNVDLDIVGKNIKKNLDNANKSKVPYVIFVGEKELEQKKVKLRDMESGEEELLSVDDLIKKMKKL
ncbi:histidine--tRNA ligase [archaeon]|jgi:histidyl-tRNA synthetase|nr:histidine--tRNA ligase [archaeon]MBT6824327.1 histidine--tRNA ligase [archaeon]MBT7106877.1 histidine--tRNA ligase [archaeon]MBT7297429.1 histidine--tRNA ligase [archaeon]